MSDISATSTDEILKPSVSYGSTVWSSRGSLQSESATATPTPTRMQRLREFIKQLRGNKPDANANGPAINPPVNQSILKSGPSSVKTVLMVAGLMCVGFMLVASGIIIVSTEHNRQHKGFLICGSVFICLGVLFFVVCLIVQKKNFLKHMERLEKSLYLS